MNQPAGQANNSPYDENVSRFVVQKQWVRQDLSIRSTAFLPNPKTAPLATSVTLIGGLTPKEVWRLAIGVANDMGKQLYGRTDINVKAVFSANLKLSLTPTSNNTSHADIVGWPEDKPSQKNRAQMLAAKASRLIRSPI